MTDKRGQDEEELASIVGALSLSMLLACLVLVVRYWDDIRCYLPDVPRWQLRSRSTVGPTPIESQQKGGEQCF